MTSPYNFGMSQEDERSEAAALGLSVDNTREPVLSVTSAGDMPLSLLALGAKRVEAVDIHQGQIQLARLKAAAVELLPREETVRFLGFLPSPAHTRLEVLDQLLRSLPPSAASFWRTHRKVVARGPIWGGRYERYTQALAKIATRIFGRRKVQGLFECETLADQAAYFDRHVDRKSIRWIFRVAFHPRVYARRGMDPRGLRQRRDTRSLGEQFFERFRWLCVATPARRNHLLQLSLLGRVLDLDSLPTYLESTHYLSVREGLRDGRLTFHERDIVSYIASAPPGAFTRAHLSNVTDWLPEAEFHDLLRNLASRAQQTDGPLRVVWRYLHVDREPPNDLKKQVILNRELGDSLQKTDRFPVYSIVPAEFPAQSQLKGVTP